MARLQIDGDFEAYKKRKYGKDISWDILKDYVREDDLITFHEEDPDLEKIEIYLPVSPDWRLIDGFGLPAREQKFQRPKVPRRVEQMEKDVKYWKLKQGDKDEVNLDDMHDFMLVHQKEYRDEIAFIKKMWYYRLYGYWCFINGKPTYIDGWHWYYLTHFPIDIGFADYRDRDRRFFLGIRYFSETTEATFSIKLNYLEEDELKTTHFNNDEEMNQYIVLLKSENEKKGIYCGSFAHEFGHWVKDMGSRTTLGVNYPKHRREGATYKADCIGIEVLTRSYKKIAGIISMTGSHAQEAYKTKVMQPFRGIPWYFKPNYEGSDDPKKDLSLKPGARRIGSKGTFVSSKDGLESTFQWATTSDGRFYDSKKLIYLHEDECGKTEEQDVYFRHSTTKHCLQQGDGKVMVGFTVKTSTVGEMTKKGGGSFFKLCEASKNNERNQFGMTETRLVNIFIPAYDGLEGFIGPYGESVIDDPDEIQAEFIGGKYGAKRHLEVSEQQIRMRKDAEAMEDLNEHLRLHPTRYRDCFRKNTSSNGFNIAILNERTNELQFLPDAVEKGKFIYNNSDERVYWERDNKGPWRLSLNLEHRETNRIHKDENGFWTPTNPDRFIGSADAFKYLRTEGNKMSKFGGSFFWNRDYNIDPSDKPIDEWSSHRFVADYLDRPSTLKEPLEQMLYACIYFGCKMSPEINVPDVWRYFEENGFGNFLYYFMDKSTGKYRKTPGFNSLTGSKNDIFNAWRNYIEQHGKRDRHARQLQQAMDINGIEEMTKYDLFTSAGGCLISSEEMNPPSSDVLKTEKQSEEIISLENIYGYQL